MKVFSGAGCAVALGTIFLNAVCDRSAVCFTMSPAWDIITTMRGIISPTAATIAHLESHKNLFLTYVRSGTMYFETDQLYCVERGQIGLVDCRRPHHFYTKGDAEALWIHFDGANAEAFFEQILAFRGGRQVLTPPADLRIEQELAQIISGLRTGDMTELDRSQRIYESCARCCFRRRRDRTGKRCHCTGGQVYRRTPV